MNTPCEELEPKKILYRALDVAMRSFRRLDARDFGFDWLSRTIKWAGRRLKNGKR